MINLISTLQLFFGDDFLFNFQQRLIRSAMKKHIRSYLSGSVIRKIDVLEKFPEINVIGFDWVLTELFYDGYIIHNNFEIEIR